MRIRKFYRHLVDNYTLFTRFQIWRTSKNYPAKVLNDSYRLDTPTIHFIHRYITNNTGDLACGYYQYFLSAFENFKCIVHDVNSVNFSLIKKEDIVIIGGGGLLNATAEWNYNINKSAELAGKSVVWSAGFNSNHNTAKKVKNGIDFSLFDLVAVRDFNYANFRYVPCATCVMPEISKEYTLKREVGLLAHKDFPYDILGAVHHYEKMTNSTSLPDMIEFIGSSEVILTNSYHAVYWSTLMQKKCVLFAPRSEKYDFYKYPPILFSGDVLKDISQTSIYPNALAESKKLTHDYLRDILLLVAGSGLTKQRERL